MKVIICGAGQVGYGIAERLATEGNDVSVIDSSASLVQVIRDQLDVRGFVGHGSQPDVLQAAGAEDADMIIGVTLYDEVFAIGSTSQCMDLIFVSSLNCNAMFDNTILLFIISMFSGNSKFTFDFLKFGRFLFCTMGSEDSGGYLLASSVDISSYCRRSGSMVISFPNLEK